jgi:Uma2 family endonuclease
VLIIEVLSESTYDVDLDLKRGKGYSYVQAGVREYLTIDPTHTLLESGIRAWRLVEGVYRPWEPDAGGRWQSEEIAVAIGLEGTLATVYTRQGKRVLHEGEVEEELARLRAEVERMRRLLDERQGAQE